MLVINMAFMMCKLNVNKILFFQLRRKLKNRPACGFQKIYAILKLLAVAGVVTFII